MYYPKSQITTGLHSNGEFKLVSTNESYIGKYFKLSKGTYFTGTPDDPSSQEIILDNFFVDEDKEVENVLNPNNHTYNELVKYSPNTSSLLKTPKFNITQPTQQEYKDVIFYRYFCKKVNELLYIEIDKETYLSLKNKEDKYNWHLYTPFILPWYISGFEDVVYNINKQNVKLLVDGYKMYKFESYLKEDYLKWYIKTN